VVAYWIGLALGVVGGGVGVTVAAPLVRVPREVEDHDLRVLYLNQDGRRWLAHRKLQLDRETANELVYHGNMQEDGALIEIRRTYLEDAVQDLEEQVYAAELEFDAMMNQERWWHRCWIACFRWWRPARPRPSIREEAIAAVARWRDECEVYAVRTGVAARPWRATDLMTRDALAQVREQP
jgi:hypothetical protein